MDSRPLVISTADPQQSSKTQADHVRVKKFQQLVTDLTTSSEHGHRAMGLPSLDPADVAASTPCT